MNDETQPVRIIAWGNRGRRDDGVALVLAERLEAHYTHTPEVIIEQYHQLGPELAEDLHRSRLVLFLDAHTRDDAADVLVERVTADHRHGLDTHHCPPGQILALAECLGWMPPPAYLVGIRAEDMDFGETLSPHTTTAMLEAERRVIDLIAVARDPAGMHSQHQFSIKD